MRDRGCQFADSRIPVEVCKLCEALAQFDFGETATTPFAARPPSAPWVFWGRAPRDTSEQTGPPARQCSSRCPADGQSKATADSRQMELPIPGC